MNAQFLKMFFDYRAWGCQVGVTMPIHGFQKVKASIMWAASVVTTANITQTTFLPVLSTIKPKTGDAGAEMMYTILGKKEQSMKGEC